MTEAFLHYLWQYRLFSAKDLTTTDGLPVEVIRPGMHNTDAGPDFFNARVRINGTLWAGNVEIHVHASDWQRHLHHQDDAYDTCILHVVLEDDAPAIRKDGSIIPSLSLAGRFPDYLWGNYIALLQRQSWVACEDRIREVDEITIRSVLERNTVSRLEDKVEQISRTLDQHRNDWEETFYIHLARSFGFHVNAIPFEILARSLPYRLVMKYRDRANKTEALLFGQAGFFNREFTDSYPQQLSAEYIHLSTLHQLKPMSPAAWKFLRLRPNNFPTIRIAQFAALLSAHANLFSQLMESANPESVNRIFQVAVSSYWQSHFMFDKPSGQSPKIPGRNSVENILINTVVPFLFAWGLKQGAEDFKKRALDFLEMLPAEENRIIRLWKSTGIRANSAFDTQALIELKLHCCDEKKCLECGIGNRLINSMPG